MTQQLQLKLDNECLKINDPRMDRVRSGKLSLQALCLLMRPDDVFVLSGDTIYALSPRQWYALHSPDAGELLTKETFEAFLDKPPSNLTANDRKTVDYIRVDSRHCPACRYKRHKETVWKLIKKYGYPTSAADRTDRYPSQPYPETSGEVREVLDLDPKVYAGQPERQRVECIDCVEKHVAQAYVLACETLNGYADYLPLVSGHLCEALAELPAGQQQLKGTLEMCLAKTNMDRVPFVPLFAIMPLITQARRSLQSRLENVDQTGNAEMDIEFTQEMRDEIDVLDKDTRLEVRHLCELVRNSILRVENPPKVDAMKWEGAMATLGDRLAQAGAIKTAAMVRARRLMFVADPIAAEQACYSVDGDLGSFASANLSEGL